ncbi:MAG TPA: DAK2 domain-containing protein [Solirubrobacterales bacterium]|nr:DAK2 domain-containing protein [Solirubrobacterales bacterium]
MPDPSIERFHRVVRVAHEHLRERRQEVNDLNVFPVPDGDTGDNMLGTIRAVLDGLDGLRSNSLAAVDRNYIVQTVAHSALMGARGNSGVILSQIVRGAAEVLSTRRGELIGPALVRDALARASEAAWESVGDPREGTMLTVIREVHDAVAAKVEELDRRELDANATEAEQDAMLAELMVTAVGAAQQALERTPEQLDVLAEAGVVDAGAYGLVVILAGLVAGLAGQDAGHSPVPHQTAAPGHGAVEVSSRFRYCTSCIVTGDELDPRSIAPRLEELGDSIAVVGDETMLKVHVHTDTPSRARAICAEHGDVHQFEFTDMRRQIAERDDRLAGGAGVATGVVAVACGDGISELFAGEGARVVDGGPTLNPSINEILEGIRATPGDEVIVLPNSPNVILAAEEAAKLSERPVRVLPSTSQQAGLLALVGAFDAAGPGDVNADRMAAELDAVTEALVAAADKDDPEGRYRRGEAVGFVGDSLVAWGEPQHTLATVIAEIARDAEIVTVLEGADAPLRAEAVDLDDSVELEIHAGGQPTYWWLLASQ